MDRRMECMTRILSESTQGKPFHEHFGVHGRYHLSRMGPTTFQLNVNRTKSFVVKFKGIPEEIERHISSFLHKHFICTIEFTYVDVFRSPLFKLIHYDSNLFINMENILRYHSQIYERSWSPAFTLEKDILHLICMIMEIIH